MKELVRCRPCGFVIESDKLGDVCPACGLPRKVFEPYREKVSVNRLKILNLDLHPIAIHLSQTFVVLIPAMFLITKILPDFQFTLFKSVLTFSVYIFPLTLLLAIITGIVDGLTRFKSLLPPLLRIKVIFSLIIFIISVAIFLLYINNRSGILPITLSIISLGIAIRLGLWGKKLINVILPGTYPQKKGARLKEKETSASQ